ncbi:sensor histidine kinase [Flavobacterium sp. LC2016-23]|uniref:histidine kinase n=1 Tax=Flavobacterium sp. LC2016-23 TaxID=2666330 RepID=UPI0012B08F64|nr:histidine kinase [Flavobacterium sp. LC2016-23]MRX38175.1 sensor histidine kinase [Flavobacterium sp. LC2016-23]
MKFRFSNITSRRAFLIYGTISILLTVISVYFLSSLITDLTEKSNEEAAQRNFIKKQEFMSQEFSKFLEQENQIKNVVKISNSKNLSANLEVLSSIQMTSSLLTNNWFKINDREIHFGNDTVSTALKNNIRDFVLQNTTAQHISTVIPQGKEWIWRIYFKLVSPDNTTVRYGYDINLKALHDYFATIDGTAPNYAFVFDQKGTCIFHPESDFIGKNVYDISSLKASDTIFNKNQDYVKRVTLSEYLKLDVIRFTKRVNLKGSHWYICVSFPKDFVVEDVTTIKKYTTLIYSITTVMLLLIFYLFTYANRRAYQEKEVVIQEKNTLLVENEKIVKEKALMQLQQLIEQINPHFLFNSLNSLYMLIDSDIKTAQKFTLNLSRIYRYLIDPPEKNIVLLKNELLFIEKYIFLQQTRFREELFFSIEIEDESALTKSLPYLAFQIVIENAIKHNMATSEIPLHTRIVIKADHVVISNNLQPKQNSEPGTKFGLNYLRSIYSYYSKTDFQATEKEGNFVCILPLIDIHS